MLTCWVVLRLFSYDVLDSAPLVCPYFEFAFVAQDFAEVLWRYGCSQLVYISYLFSAQ